MTEKRVTLEVAAFLDSPHAFAIESAPTATIHAVVERFLSACYEDMGLAPHLLDAEGLRAVLTECLPRRFGVRDPTADCVGEVLDHFLRHLDESAVVTHKFELLQAFDPAIEAFRAAVSSGAAHASGVAAHGPGKTIKHRAEKTGRNDPCPCGSGKKFKKCCMQL